MDGWIKLHRKFTERGRYTDIPTKSTFLHFVLNANHQEKDWNGIKIGVGQLITGSIKTPKDIGITRQQYRLAIGKLEKTGEITIKTTNKYTLITLVNWDIYQTDNKKQPPEQPSNNHQTTTPKEYKNDKKYINKEIYKEKCSEIIDEYISEGFKKEELEREANDCWRHWDGKMKKITAFSNWIKKAIKIGNLKRTPQILYINQQSDD